MLEYVIYMLPLLILLGGISCFALINFTQDETNKCFKFCRVLLTICLISIAIFYNKPLMAGLTVANHFTIVFEMWLYLSALLVLYISRKWFVNMKQNGSRFCYALLLAVLSGSLLIVSKNLALTGGAIALLIFGNIRILQTDTTNKQSFSPNRIYQSSALVCLIILFASIALFYHYGHHFTYSKVNLFLGMAIGEPLIFVATAGVVICFMFLLSAAPLHYWLTENSARVSLPVFSYFLLVPSGICLAAFIRFVLNVLPPLNSAFALFFVGVAFMSVFVGAVGACSGQNIRKILAYGYVFQIGIIILVLQHFNIFAARTALTYWFVAWMAMLGAIISLYSLKSRGEYLSMLVEYAGAKDKCPLIALMLTFCLFSMMGLPPLIGAVGYFGVLNNLAFNNHFYALVYILLMLLVIAYAYLQIIKSINFDDNRNNFDRYDKGVAILLCVISALMMILVFHPYYLLEQPWIMELVNE